ELDINADGTFTYTPVATFIGLETFTFQAVDILTGAVSSNVAVSFTVTTGATYTVTSNADTLTPGTLRFGLTYAAPNTTITFQAGGLTGGNTIDASLVDGGLGTFNILQNITIQGPNPSDYTLTIEGGSAAGDASNAQLFYINQGVTATLRNATIQN